MIDNAILISLILAFILVAVALSLSYIKLPKQKRIENLCEWLKWAVTEAEKALGSGTGQLKLRYVYSLACQTFKWVPKALSFEEFSILVDNALYWLKIQLNSNAAIDIYVKGITDDDQ